MPTRPPRHCSTPGCGGTAVPPSGKCEACQGRARRPRPSAAAQGYGREHETRFRAAVLARDQVCVLCRARPAEHADHWPETRRELVARGADPNDPDHGRGLCPGCHSAETARTTPGGWHRPGPRY